ncbi:hypothetical protein BC827DRAFT_1271686 [Russula dissimulans]|nr:hypothetical protein BC827DRAFT_1271686 [Russula dissimulans]
MSQAHLSPAARRLPSITTRDQAISNHQSQHPSSRYTLRPYPNGIFIHILDQDSLLHILYLCRPVLLDEDETDDTRILQGGLWTRERWWYKLAQVCRRWRYLILGFPLHLGLSLVCSRGTPVAEMLEHSPPLPLIIDHVDHGDSITTVDEEGIMLALKNHDSVRRIRLVMPVPNLQKVIMTLDHEFPMLEWLYIRPPSKQNTSLTLPKSFRAPHLRHLKLSNFAFPIGSPSLTAAVGLVTLSLGWISPSVYFHPNDLVHRLSQMPHLETLGITFHSPVADCDVKRELLRRPLTTHITLPNLRWFAFGGVSAYLEALLPSMTAPLLAKLRVGFHNRPTYHLPHLLQFLNTAENLRFSSVTLVFSEKWFSAIVYPNEEARMYAFYMKVGCRHLDEQVASAAQIFKVLRSAFSAVESLTLEYWKYYASLKWLYEADLSQWRDLLRSFGNVKALRVDSALVCRLSRSLQFEDGESPMELLPELKELSYDYRYDLDDAFTAFIDARRIAGRPVAVLYR